MEDEEYIKGYSFRHASQQDAQQILDLMTPFIKSGALLPRSLASITQKIGDYEVALWGATVCGSMALHVYDGGQGEIAGVAISPAHTHQRLATHLVERTLQKARLLKLRSVFLLTTQDPHWFRQFAFVIDSVASLPPQRRAIWSPSRNSKVFRKWL